MHEYIKNVLVGPEELSEAVTRIAAQIDKDYGTPDKNLVMVCTLKGAVVFFADLMKKITIPTKIDFVKASSYGNSTESSGNLKIGLDISCENVEDCDLLVIEDIVDSGITLSRLTAHLKAKGAKSVKTCTLFDKPERRRVDFNPDYVGIVIPDEFIVGYGLDYAEDYRALPFVGVLKPEAYNK